jgi:hypothetical protein
VYRSQADEHWLRRGKVRNDNFGIARDALLFSISESSQVRCSSRFLNRQTENSGIAAGAMLFSIPDSAKERIP